MLTLCSTEALIRNIMLIYMYASLIVRGYLLLNNLMDMLLLGKNVDLW